MEMRVYKDITAYEPKPMFGLTWRQLGAVAVGGPITLGVFAGTTYLYLAAHGWYFTSLRDLLAMSADDQSLVSTATNIALVPTFLAFIPFAIYGWLRPKGLKPERYIPYWFDYMKNPKELCYGSDAYDRGPTERPHGESVDRGGARRTRAERRQERKAQRFIPSEHAPAAVPGEAASRPGH